MFKKHTALIIFLLTLLLGGIAVFTAARLRKTEEPVPPQPTKAAGPEICGGRQQIESCTCTATSANTCPAEVQALCEDLSIANDNYPVTCHKCDNCGGSPISLLDNAGDSIFWHCIESGNASFEAQTSDDCCSGFIQGRIWLDNDGNGVRQSNQEPFITDDPAVTVQVGTTPTGGDYRWKRAGTYSDGCTQNAPYQTQYPAGELKLRVQLPDGWTVTGARVNPNSTTCQGGDTLQSRGMRGLCWQGSIEDETCTSFVVQDFHVGCNEGKDIWIGIKESGELPPPENEPPACESLIRTPAGSLKTDDLVTFECGGSDRDGTINEIVFKIVHSEWEIIKTCRRDGSGDCLITDLGEGRFSAQIPYTISEAGTYEVYSKVCDNVGVCTEFTR